MTQTDRLDGVTEGVAYKRPVRVATTANITLSGTQTIDGVAVVDGNRVLVKDQSDATENGIYVASTGDWTRAADFDGARDFVEGTGVYVIAGTVSAGKTYRCTPSDDDDDIEIDSTETTWAADGQLAPTSVTGALVHIETKTASNSSSLDFTTGLDNTYDRFVLKGVSLRPATDGTTVQVRSGTGAGPTYDTTSYQYSFHGHTAAGSAADAETESTSAAAITLGLAVGNAAQEGVNFEIEINDPDSSAILTQFGFAAWGVNASTQPWAVKGNGQHGTAGETLTGLRVMMASGNITSGIVSLFGVKKS